MGDDELLHGRLHVVVGDEGEAPHLIGPEEAVELEVVGIFGGGALGAGASRHSCWFLAFGELAPTKDCLLDDGPSTSRWGNITARTRKQHEGALPEAGDDVWEVARLVDKRKGGCGRTEYLVRRWLLYP